MCLLGPGAAGEEVERHPHAGHAGVGEEQRPQRPEVGSAHADRDEGVHGGCAVAQVRPGRSVERQGAPHDDGGGQGQGEPLPVVELQGRHHGHQEHRHAQDGRDDQALAPRGGLFVLGALRGIHRGAGGVRGGWGRQGCRVAGGLDGGDEVGRVHVGGEADLGLLGRVVHRGRDAGHLVQLLLDPRGAGRAGHAPDDELDVAVVLLSVVHVRGHCCPSDPGRGPVLRCQMVARW